MSVPTVTPQRQSGGVDDEAVVVADHGHLDAERVDATLGTTGTPTHRSEATRPRVVPVHPQHRGREPDAARWSLPAAISARPTPRPHRSGSTLTA